MELILGTQADYDAHIVASDREWLASLYYWVNGAWENADDKCVKSFQISDYSTDGSNITMGTVVGGKLTLSLINVSSSVAYAFTQGTQLRLRLTLRSSQATNRVVIQSKVFVIDDKKLVLRKGGTYDVSITAYDFSYIMTDKYVSSSERITAPFLIAEIAQKYGFDVGESVEETILRLDGIAHPEITVSEVLGGAYTTYDGQWVADEGETYSRNTGFVKILSGYDYLYNGKGMTPIASVCWYDSNKSFISADVYSGYAVITPPSTAVYAIFQSYSTDGNVTLSVTPMRVYTPLADFTCKQTIGYMAGCYGCFAYFDSYNTLQFGWYEDNGDFLTTDRIYNGSAYVAEMEEREIVMLETGTSNKPIVVPNNAKGYSINFENPYISAEQAQAIYDEKIAGGQIYFKIGKLSYKGNPLNSPKTIITVSDVQGSVYPFYIMKRTLRYDGGLGETIECQGESETTINYKLTSPTQQKINRALSRMEEAIKNATDVITQTKGSVFEFIPIDENDPSKGNSGWKLYSTEIGSRNVILANSSGIGFSSNGGQSFDAAAIYIDKDGTGHINGNFITAGSISADKIDTSQLIVSKENVNGLDTELEELLKTAEEAEKTANSANTAANTASSNASSALSVANSANGVIADWCYNNNTTYIDGANIYTGTISAKQIAAESITADKLSVGIAKRENLFYNPEFTENYTDDGTTYAEGWTAFNGTIEPKDGWMIFRPTSSSTNSGFSQKVWLKPGVYSIVAQLNLYNISSVGSNARIGYRFGATYSYDTTSQNIGNSSAVGQNKEMNIKYVYNYTGSEGFVDVGLYFRDMVFSGYITVAWMALFNADEEQLGANFYCSDSSWLKSAYKTSHLLTYSTNINSFVNDVNPFTVDDNGELDVLSGTIGCLKFKRLGLNIESHVSDSILGLTFDGYLEISKPTGAFVFGNVSDFNDTVSASKAFAPSLDITNDSGTRSFMGIYGYYCADSSYTSIVRPRKIETTGTMEATAFNDTSREKYKQNIELKSSVLDKIKSSKIYEYFYKQDGQSAKRKTGFIVERETPEDIISDDGNGINLYSMASMNWKATQELLERLEAVEKAVNLNA